MALQRHGAMGTIFDHPYAPSTLGSVLRAFTFGHVRQLDAVASRVLCGLAPAERLSSSRRAGCSATRRRAMLATLGELKTLRPGRATEQLDAR